MKRRIANKDFAEYKVFQNEKDLEIDHCNFADGMSLQDCQRVVVRNCKSVGGFYNFEACRSVDCRFEICLGRDPIRHPKVGDVQDWENHNYLLNACTNCIIDHCTADSELPRGDAFNLFYSTGCKITDSLCTGPLCHFACAGIIDCGSQNCTIDHLHIIDPVGGPAGRVHIAHGNNHKLLNTTLLGAVEVANGHYGWVKDLTIQACNGPELFVVKRWIKRMALINSTFTRSNYNVN